jgi:hypothetical protein
VQLSSKIKRRFPQSCPKRATVVKFMFSAHAKCETVVKNSTGPKCGTVVKNSLAQKCGTVVKSSFCQSNECFTLFACWALLLARCFKRNRNFNALKSSKLKEASSEKQILVTKINPKPCKSDDSFTLCISFYVMEHFEAVVAQKQTFLSEKAVQ